MQNMIISAIVGAALMAVLPLVSGELDSTFREIACNLATQSLDFCAGVN